MPKQFPIAVVLIIIMSFFKFFWKIANRARFDKNDPSVQIIPLGARIAEIFLYIFTGFVICMFLLMVYVAFAQNLPEDTGALIALFIAMLFFIGLSIWTRNKMKGNQYQEMSQSFTVTRQGKETIMNYQDIEDWNLAGKDLIVLDRRQEALIHLNWFRPKILLEQLLRKQEKGDFIYQGDKEISVADIVLQRLIRKANRP